MTKGKPLISFDRFVESLSGRAFGVFRVCFHDQSQSWDWFKTLTPVELLKEPNVGWHTLGVIHSAAKKVGVTTDWFIAGHPAPVYDVERLLRLEKYYADHLKDVQARLRIAREYLKNRREGK